MCKLFLMKRNLPPTPSKMPAAKRAKRTTTRKRKTWKSKNAFELVRPVFTRTAFPASKITTLKYTEGYITVDAPVGSSAGYVFRANGLFDPNYTGTGHQPLGFDQWCAMYNRYVVLASKIKVTFYATDTETLDVVAGVAVYDTTTTASSIEKYMEQPMASWTVIPAGAGADTKTCYAAFDVKTFNGNLPLDDVLQGNPSSDPGRLWYYHVFCGATGAAENPGALKATLEIEYKVKFFSPVTLALS